MGPRLRMARPAVWKFGYGAACGLGATQALASSTERDNGIVADKREVPSRVLHKVVRRVRVR